jgi:hypothetical protein
MTVAVSRKVPPQRLITLMNPIVRALLRSPLHRFVDDELLILHITGRRTGHRYDIPVGYMEVDGRFVVVTQHRWRANIRGGADVVVTRGGLHRKMHAELDEEPASVGAILQAAIERVGWRAMQRLTGFRTTVGQTPTVSELEEAVGEHHLAAIILTER